MIKPEEKKEVKKICEDLDVDRKGKPLSIDLYMRNMSLLKEEEINNFFFFMKRFSIEKYPIVSTESIKPALVIE
jgi:hypothetical protein